MKDSEIIENIWKGKEDPAIRYLYQKVFPPVLHWIRKNSGEKEEAQDIFQEAILIVYKQIKMGTYDPKYAIQAYMFSICKNLWVNYIKRKNKQKELPEEVNQIQDDQNVLANIISKEREKYVMDLFAQLGERCKELLILSFYHKYSSQEIALKMGFGSEDMVKTKKYKCKQRLSVLMAEYQGIKDSIA